MHMQYCYLLVINSYVICEQNRNRLFKLRSLNLRKD